jgi:putative hydrolase of the HAD superfamily
VSSAPARVFFDIGGVLGTNGWDREQRRAAAGRFALDADDLDRRHKEVVASWEEGRMAWDEYLDFTVFHAERPFGRDEFKAYVLALSEPFEDAVAVARELALAGRAKLYTLNNESAALNVHRIRAFGLGPLFAAFCSSCWLGVRKPERSMYERALAIAGAEPNESVFVDDRSQNLAPARALGMRAVLYRGSGELRRELAELGLLQTG